MRESNGAAGNIGMGGGAAGMDGRTITADSVTAGGKAGSASAGGGGGGDVTSADGPKSSSSDTDAPPRFKLSVENANLESDSLIPFPPVDLFLGSSWFKNDRDGSLPNPPM